MGKSCHDVSDKETRGLGDKEKVKKERGTPNSWENPAMMKQTKRLRD